MAQKKQITRSKRSRDRARQARREAREVREMLKMPVNTQRDVERRSRARRSLIMRLTCWLGVLTLLVLGGVMVFQKAFYENPEFTLKRVDARTDGTLTRSELLSIAAIPAVSNLLELDLEAIRRRLLDRSQIMTAQVTRQLPHTLMINVRERQPVVWLGHWGGEQDKREEGVLLDAHGIAICCHNLYRRLFELPVIRVTKEVMENQVIFGERVDVAEIHEALKLYQLWPASSPNPLAVIEEIDITRMYRMDVYCHGDLKLLMNYGNLSGQLTKFADVWRHAEAQDRYFAQVDLTVTNNVPVIYQPEGYEPPVKETKRPSLRRAPQWQPRPPDDASIDNGLTEDERSILAVES